MQTESDAVGLQAEVVRRYDVDPAGVRTVFAPYRICPLGAHIDHQLGQVTALALDFGVSLAYAPTPAPEVRVSSLNFPGEVHVRFGDIPDKRPRDWGNYVRGAIRALQQDTTLNVGLVGVTQGAVSEGGLSSSAAIGVAYLLALEEVNGLRVLPEDNVRLDQYIENTYLGLRNGILDQSAILFARQEQLAWIDCLTNEFRHVAPSPAAPQYQILIAFSGLRESLIHTDYNRRVSECAEAARILLRASGRAESTLLRNVTGEEYAQHRHLLPEAVARRADHFFSEMARVRQGVVAWEEGNLREFGRLITASGESSIHHYECGAPPLIALYETLVQTPGVFGARFSGAGFRGCCLALVEPPRVHKIADEIQRKYAARCPDLAQQASVMVSESGDGARWLVGGPAQDAPHHP